MSEKQHSERYHRLLKKLDEAKNGLLDTEIREPFIKGMIEAAEKEDPNAEGFDPMKLKHIKKAYDNNIIDAAHWTAKIKIIEKMIFEELESEDQHEVKAEGDDQAANKD